MHQRQYLPILNPIARTPITVSAVVVVAPTGRCHFCGPVTTAIRKPETAHSQEQHRCVTCGSRIRHTA